MNTWRFLTMARQGERPAAEYGAVEFVGSVLLLLATVLAGAATRLMTVHGEPPRESREMSPAVEATAL